MKQAVVTGASGFIGRALTQKLLASGYTVYGLSTGRRTLPDRPGNYVPLTADYREYHRLADLLPKNVDAFIHSASIGQLKGKDLNNIDIQIENICCACEAAKLALKVQSRRYVLISSSYQYMHEVGSENCASMYGCEKAAAEDLTRLLLKGSGIKYNIAVLTNTFGPGDSSGKAVNTFLKALLTNKDLSLITGERPNDWVYIDDTINGIIAILQSGKAGKKYYIGHVEISSFKNKLLEMKKVLHSDSKLNFGTYCDNSFVDYTKLDAKELYRDTGFQCRCDFRESILKTAEWVKTLDL